MSLKTKLKVENMSYVAVEGYAGTLVALAQLAHVAMLAGVLCLSSS
jgi:hypothetical protein